MTSVEIVKTICKQRKIPFSKLEKDLDYGNGYIGQLKKGILPNDRAAQIADYLDIPIEYLNVQEIDAFICEKISERYRMDPRVLSFVPDEIKAEIADGTYKFDSETFPQFSRIINKDLEDVIAENCEKSEKKSDLSKLDKTLLDLFHRLNPEGKNRLIEEAEMLVKNEKFMLSPDKKEVV